MRETPSVCSARFSVDHLEPGAYLMVAWRDGNGNGLLELGDWVGAFVTPEASASFSPSISGADFDLQTLDVELAARLEALRLPVSLEAKLVNTVVAP